MSCRNCLPPLPCVSQELKFRLGSKCLSLLSHLADRSCFLLCSAASCFSKHICIQNTERHAHTHRLSSKVELKILCLSFMYHLSCAVSVCLLASSVPLGLLQRNLPFCKGPVGLHVCFSQPKSLAYPLFTSDKARGLRHH